MTSKVVEDPPEPAALLAWQMKDRPGQVCPIRIERSGVRVNPPDPKGIPRLLHVHQIECCAQEELVIVEHSHGTLGSQII